METEKCPKCGAEMPVNPGFITWCDKCGWNINFDVRRKSNKDIFEILSNSENQQVCKKVFDNINKEVKKNRKKRPAAIIACIIALAVHLCTILWFLLGLDLIIFHLNALTFPMSMLCLIISRYLMPKFSSFVEHGIPRAVYPEIYNFVDKISKEMNAPKIDIIVFNYDFNASFKKVGIKGKRVLTIGTPLFSILSEEERIALLAHEIGHNVNNDVGRSFLIESALVTLARIYFFMNPTKSENIWLIILLPITLIRWLISKVVFRIWYSFGRLVWSDRQYSEYLADYLASKISGSGAELSLLQKLYYYPTFYLALERVIRYKYNNDVLDEFKKCIKNVPEREIKRISLLEKSELSRVDASHPPTSYRVDFIKQNYISQRKIKLSQSELERLNYELIKIENNISNGLINDYREYYARH